MRSHKQTTADIHLLVQSDMMRRACAFFLRLLLSDVT